MMGVVCMMMSVGDRMKGVGGMMRWCRSDGGCCRSDEVLYV